jgi:serine/threonine protein phosphatase 1
MQEVQNKESRVKRTLVMGDPHGARRAIDQVFERSGFDKKRDRLIVLGDVCDGWPETPECIDVLMEVDDLVYMLGNHDQWAYQWMVSGWPRPEWLTQGGQATYDAYLKSNGHHIERHANFLGRAKLFYIDEQNRLFVHAGIDPMRHPIAQGPDNLIWSRDLWTHWAPMGEATGMTVTEFKEIFIGHTQVHMTPDGGYAENKVPVRQAEIWNLDTGAGWDGKLSLMDVDTKEYWQSDIVETLYPESGGRTYKHKRKRTTA